ncbi:5-methylcytosine-specific restriction endonuclease McrBC regulatory subunit McrC [Kitasatospora sp. GP82]|nr:5-methylcytosine-specific restriction endonuclease McrBC regulatory subunit McrC [Kitasatospora sp. GP82]
MDDLYQMLAYATALGLPSGHLVYARGGAPAALHRIRNAGTRIQQHDLDLDQPPERLLADLAGITGAMAG